MINNSIDNTEKTQLTLAERIELEETENREIRIKLLEDTLNRFEKDGSLITINIYGSPIEGLVFINQLDWTYSNEDRKSITLRDLDEESGTMLSLSVEDIVECYLDMFDLEGNTLRVGLGEVEITLSIG